jgi:hypothetical protein
MSQSQLSQLSLRELIYGSQTLPSEDESSEEEEEGNRTYRSPYFFLKKNLIEYLL